MKLSLLIRIAVITFCLSCNSSFDKNIEDELITNINQNNIMLDIKAKNIINDLKAKSQKPETREKGLYWLEKVCIVDSVFESFRKDLDSKYEKSRLNLDYIQNQFFSYKNKIEKIDESISKEIHFELQYKEDISFFSSLKSSNVLKNNSKILVQLLKNKANILRNHYSEVCQKQVGVIVDGYDKFQAIASQNSMHFKPNQEIEIHAGIGAFSSKANPSIIISGDSIILNAEGVAEYKANVGNKKGRFSKKLKISFTTPYGRKESVEKEILYTVD